MKRQIYVNLPVRDLAASKSFFQNLGFQFNPQFTNGVAACMIVSDDIYVMLLTEPFFEGFAANPICDARKSTEVILCLSCNSRREVDALVAKAVAAGGKVLKEPQVHGEAMYGHGFQDLDGHCWEVMHMAVPDGV
jgi:predicted lactoylglutathione lyase